MPTKKETTKEDTMMEWFNSTKSLSEIYQQTGMLFAFVTAPKDKKQKVCHPWVKCRDFLHDAVRTQITKKPSGIYGFEFNVKDNPPIDLRKTRMLVSAGRCDSDEEKQEFLTKMEYALNLLVHFEKRAGVAHSKMKEINPEKSGKKVIVMFTSSPMWLTSPFLVSMYTFLIRLGDKKIEFKNAADLKKEFKKLADLRKAGKISDNDASYLDQMHDKLHTIIDNRTKLFPKTKRFHTIYNDDININTFHNCGGILSLCKGITPSTELNTMIKEMKVK